MKYEGYIKLHRRIIQWEWFNDMPTRCAFEFLLLKANHKEQFFKGKKIERGATLTSYKEISEKNGMSVQNARTAIKHLKSTHEITCEKMLNGLYIKVLNYDYFQEDNTQTNTQLTHDQHSTNIRLTTNKNDKNDNNEKNIYINTSVQSDLNKSSAHGNKVKKEIENDKVIISLPLNDGSNFEVVEYQLREWQELYPGTDVITELRKMKGWLNSNPAKRKTKRGILRFVTGWLAREQDRNTNRKSNVQGTGKPMQPVYGNPGFNYANIRQGINQVWEQEDEIEMSQEERDIIAKEIQSLKSR